MLDINQIEKKKQEFKKFLETQFNDSKNYKSEQNGLMEFGQIQTGFRKDKRGVSGVDKKTLIETGKRTFEIPKDFNIHKTLKKILEQKQKMFTENSPIDWSTAESLAFTILLIDGFSVDYLVKTRKGNF